MKIPTANPKHHELELDSSGGGILTWLIFAILTTALFGLAYPIVTTQLGLVLFPEQATGSLIEKNGIVIGSSLIGQPFTGAKYFIGRPSSAGNGYDPTAASGSNLAVSNPVLIERANTYARTIAAREGISAKDIPVDLISSSGSGLDPHISVAAAEIQMARVAQARGFTVTAVKKAVLRHTQQPTLGVLGQARVNVLELNLDLDGRN